jgi:hypothetical protein
MLRGQDVGGEKDGSIRAERAEDRGEGGREGPCDGSDLSESACVCAVDRDATLPCSSGFCDVKPREAAHSCAFAAVHVEEPGRRGTT